MLLSLRPVIQYALNVVRRHQNCYDLPHWDAAKGVLRYLKETSKFELKYEKVQEGDLKLIAYVDADFAGDTGDRKSTSGYCVFLGGGLISWASKKQEVVAESTCEAEYLALCDVVKEVLWLRMMLEEIGVECKYATDIYCDNQAAMAIVKNPEHHERTKHIDIKLQFFKEAYREGKIAIEYVDSKENPADQFTMALSLELFRKHRTRLGVVHSEVECQSASARRGTVSYANVVGRGDAR